MKTLLSHSVGRILALALMLALTPLAVRAEGPEDLETNPEAIAQFNLNIGSLALDERRYLDALSYFETALEVTQRDKTRVRSLLFLATTFGSFLNSPDSALKIYRQIQSDHPKFAESAFYQESLLLFENQRYAEVVGRGRAYQRAYPQGRFGFQVEFLIDESKREIRTPEFQRRDEWRRDAEALERAKRLEDQRWDRELKEMRREAAEWGAAAKARAEKLVRLRGEERRRAEAEAQKEAQKAESLRIKLREKEAARKKAERAAQAKIKAVASKGLKRIDEPVVRVLLDKKADRIVIRGEGVRLIDRGRTVWTGSKITLRARGGRVTGQSQSGPIRASSLRVEADAPLDLTYGRKNKKKKVRGWVSLKPKGERLQVVNHVKIEDYLISVVPAESYSSWDMQALKAQALAARTYAYNDILNHAKKAYDVFDDIRSQVYAGVTREHKRTTRAVKETRGEIITAVRKGRLRPILSMFASNSGGHLADPAKEYSKHWDTSHHYLIAKPDPWSAKAGKKYLATWSFTHSAREIEKNLNRRKVRVKNLSSITPVYIGPSGRVVRVRLLHDGGKSTVIRFRPKITLGLGGRIGTLPDTITTITKRGSQFVFDGKGFGHGIGYMQSGGQMMAKAGYGYEEILLFYYPGTSLTSYW